MSKDLRGHNGHASFIYGSAALASSRIADRLLIGAKHEWRSREPDRDILTHRLGANGRVARHVAQYLGGDLRFGGRQPRRDNAIRRFGDPCGAPITRKAQRVFDPGDHDAWGYLGNHGSTWLPSVSKPGSRDNLPGAYGCVPGYKFCATFSRQHAGDAHTLANQVNFETVTVCPKLPLMSPSDPDQSPFGFFLEVRFLNLPAAFALAFFFGEAILFLGCDVSGRFFPAD